MASDDGLKPCPFCGGEARAAGGRTPGGVPVRYVECERCFAAGPTAGEPGRAAERWNRRDGDRCADGCAVDRALTEFQAGIGEPVD